MNEAKKIEAGVWDKHQVADYLGVPWRTIDKWVMEESIPSIKLGRHRRFIKEEIDKWLKRKVNKVL